MKLLLDTHTFLWLVNAPDQLSKTALSYCEDDSHELFLSVVNAWEIQIKCELGKLKLPLPLKTLIEEQQNLNKLQILPVELPHTLVLEGLPKHHKDPFDRLLIAQSMAENMHLVSGDSKFSLYDISVIW